MSEDKPGRTRRLLTITALALAGSAAFALAQWSHGAMEMAAWFLVAFCAGGLVSQFQRPRPF